MPDVFISYSRRNLEFVQQLVAALKKSGKDPWFDQLKEPLTGIAAGAPWWEAIKYGIETVDNFLFVISPDSIGSPICHHRQHVPLEFVCAFLVASYFPLLTLGLTDISCLGQTEVRSIPYGKRCD